MESKTYTDRLLSYFNANLQGWREESYSHSAQASSPVCGDDVEYRLRIDGDLIVAIDFEATGCVVSQACAAMLGELARGKTTGWVRNYPPAEYERYVNIPLAPTRVESCMMLALRCLKEAVETLEA